MNNSVKFLVRHTNSSKKKAIQSLLNNNNDIVLAAQNLYIKEYPTVKLELIMSHINIRTKTTKNENFYKNCDL